MIDDKPKKRKTFTSTAVKKRYNDKHYTNVTYRIETDIVEAFKEKTKLNKDSQADVIRQAMIKYNDSH